MLSRISIRNIALIEALEVELGAGMNVMTGETGAGKSIIVDAMNLALGERADREMIRSGQDRARVEAWFAGADECVKDILRAQEIEPDGELVLSRELSVSGKNTCRVNGVLTTLGVLKQLSDRLVDIHGQHEHQSLLHEKNHIGMLDGFDPRITPLKLQTQTAYHAYTAVAKRLRALFGDEGDRERRIDVLKFQIDEIEKADIRDGEQQALQEQKKRMNASESVMDALSASYAALYDDETANALALLKTALSKLDGIADVDVRYAAIGEQLGDAFYTLEEAAGRVRSEMDDVYFDADELETIEERLALIGTLRRKYTDPRVDGEYIADARQELEDLQNSEALIAALTDEVNAKRQVLYEASLALSAQRREAAAVFEQKLTAQLTELGMASASFSVSFADTAPIEQCSFGENGIDTVAFYISANRGEPQKPLRKVASGGEVSRIMLALKNIAADRGGIPTMIFDEIDTGISGRMAQVVAEKLKNISDGRQVICVTHLPQIASMADRHFLIEKQSTDTATTTHLSELKGGARVAEIARLSGGESSAAMLHAEEMLTRARRYGNSTQ